MTDILDELKRRIKRADVEWRTRPDPYTDRAKRPRGIHDRSCDEIARLRTEVERLKAERASALAREAALKMWLRRFTGWSDEQIAEALAAHPAPEPAGEGETG